MSDCGKKWAKNDPEGFLKALKESKNTNVARLINSASPKILKGFMGALGRDLVSPFGWLTGDIILSTLFSVAAEASGKTPLEALDEGVLWFLPKGVIDAHKKALFGYEGLPTNKRFKMEGYAGAYSQDQISDMKNYLDKEDAERKYWEAKDKRKNFETKRYDSEVTKKRVLDKIDATIKKHRAASTEAVRKIYETNTGLRTDGTPRYEDMYMEDLQAHMAQTGDNLWDVQQQYAVDYINEAKEADINRLYAQKEGGFDKAMPNLTTSRETDTGIPFLSYEKGFGKRKEGEIHLGESGPVGDIGTFLSNPFDRFYSRSPVAPNKSLPWGFRRGWNKVLDLYNLLPHASQEEKEAYARSIGRDDLLHKEYKHPIYGSSFSYDQIKRVFPDYFPYAGGGIAGIRRPWAIPPESGPDPQGLASLNNYATKRTE